MSARAVKSFGWLAAAALVSACRDDTSETGAAEDLCAEARCGEHASCSPLTGRCSCDPGHHGDPDAGCAPHGDPCGEASARVGHRACVHEVPDVPAWTAISVGSAARKDVRRVGKYLAPAAASAPLPTLFADTNYYGLHLCLLQDAFEPLFPGFTNYQYINLVYRRATREMIAGSIYEFYDDDLPARYGFTAETPDDLPELLSESEVYAVYAELAPRFAAGELGYVPYSPAQQSRALGWPAPKIPILIGGEAMVTYEPYSTGTTYGRVRRFAGQTPAEGSFGWQDILVLDAVPGDLTGVMAGVVTGGRQDVLSHLNVLSARRGTPNVFVADPLAAFAPFDGALIRLEARADAYSIQPAELAEAEAFWAEHRPSVEIVHLPDPDFRDLVALAEIPTATADERGAAVGRFGGKVTGLATLHPLLDPAYRVEGFGVPVAYYLEFMTSNGWTIPVDGAMQTISFADTIDYWLAHPEFRSDTAVRHAWLSSLEAAILQRGVVAPELTGELAATIADRFGGLEVMVRLRSSSNVEDGLEFNGAGLYTSASGCAADADDKGPSACDPDKGARPLDGALKAVWASLWSPGAFEEREYYQIDHRLAAMGVLVSTRFEDERANGVIFTGDPIDPGDDRFLVNVQLGDVDVVSPPPGVTAELDRLTLAGGEVAQIERLAVSSLAPEGEPVLSDAELAELGAVVDAVRAVYPVELGEHEPDEVLFDLEFKFTTEGQLVIKQIRPFLRGAVDPSAPGCP